MYLCLITNSVSYIKRFTMKSVLLFFLLISTTLCFAGSFDTIPANDGVIEYTGSIDFSNPNSPAFSYSVVSIRACFTGMSIAIIMNDNTGNNYLNLILDGKLLDTFKITAGQKTYKIADGLENTTHEIEIFKRTEEMFGKTQFFGFVLDNGATLVPIANKRAKLIEYIGNSITCGYGNEGINGGTFGPTTENHYMTYAAITSRNFNARHLAVCKSGIGIYRNWDGPATGNQDNMTNYYTRVFLYDENPKYSFSDQPDLVCIDLGTNDFSTAGGDSAKFVSHYFRLIDTLQLKYAKPDIICLLGPMLSDPTLTKIRKYLTSLVDSANRKGKGNVHFFEMSQQTGSLGIGIDYHPTVAQHKKNGMELTEYIKSLEGWKINPLILNAILTETKHLQIEFNTEVLNTLNNYTGFQIFGNAQEYTINDAYRDSENQKMIHLILQESMNVGEKIILSYTPGTIESVDSIRVGAINSLTVQNNLTLTKITKGTTSKDGTMVILTCNKNIKSNATIEGLSLTKNNGVITIDSFSIANKQITLTLKDTIMKADSVFARYNGTNLYGADDIPLSSFSKLVIVNNSTYSGISIHAQHFLTLYPNPNHSGIIHYRADESLFSGKIALEVINSNGITVYNQTNLKNEGEVDLRGKISKGIYFVKLHYGESEITKSIVFE